jgi:hypothetical protein
MIINGLDISEKFLLNELAEWTLPLSKLAWKIAERYGMTKGDSALVYNKVENIRKVLSRLRKRLAVKEEDMFPPFEGSKIGFGSRITPSKKYPVEWETSYTSAPVFNYGKVLPIVYIVIGDLHQPFTHEDYLRHCITVTNKYVNRAKNEFGEGNFKVRIIFIGDEVDNQAISYHEHNPNLPSASDELEQAISNLKEWYKAFENYEVFVTEGNHSLVRRKMFSAGIPRAYMKDIGEVLGVPKWNFCLEVPDNQYNLLFTHGTNLSKTSIEVKALGEQKSVICGHHHSLCKVEYVNQDIFTMFVGCGIDFSSEAFNYAKGFAKKPIISCAVIYDGVPTIETLKQ